MLALQTSLPTRERGLKRKIRPCECRRIPSLPTRERGLKLVLGPKAATSRCRSPQRSNSRGVAAEIPANIRRPPILDADEADEYSVSSDKLDNSPLPVPPDVRPREGSGDVGCPGYAEMAK